MSYVSMSYDLIVLQISAPISVSPVIILYRRLFTAAIGHLYARGHVLVIISTRLRLIYIVRKCGDDYFPDILQFACFEL